jgi:two-component system, cell cycle sensor histidine kinase PleC
MATASPEDQRKQGESASERRSFFLFRLTLIFLTLLILGAAAYGSWNEIRTDRETAINAARQRAHLLADSVAGHAYMTFRIADGAAGALAHVMEEYLRSDNKNSEWVLRYIKSSISNDTPFRNLVVANSTGAVIFDNTGIAPSFNISDRDFFLRHRNDSDSGMYISDVIRSRLGRGWFLAVSRRVNAPDGSFAGIAYATVDLTHFEREYRDVDVGDYGFVTLWAQGGKVLARVPRDPTLVEDPGAYAERISRLRAPEVTAETFTRSPLDGVTRWVIAKEVPGLPLRVSVGVAEQEVLAAWRAAVPLQIASAALVIGLVVALGIILLVYLGRLEAADAALRDSERRAHALFDSTFEYIAMLSIDGKIISANRSLQELAGDQHGTLTAEIFWMLEPWSRSSVAMRLVRDGVARAARGEFVRFECEMISPNGPRTADVSIKPICDERGMAELLIAEARDVTDRKRSEDNLRTSEARVRSYFEAAMDGIVVADRMGRFIDVNPAACRLFGFERNDMTQLTIADMLPADCGPAVTAAGHLALVNASGSYRGELQFRRSDGAVRTAEVSAVRLEGDNYLGVFRDVSQQRREAEALRAGNARIAALLRTIPDLVLLLDSNGLYLDVVTPPADSRLMIAAKRLLGRRPYDVLPTEVAARIMRAVASATASQQVETVEFELDLADGVRWFEARFTVMSEMPRDESYVLQITRDVTERVEAAARLADAKEQAEAANRTKSAFLATMSHELRTPLNAIIGFSEIMVTEMFGPVGNPRYVGYARNIHESGGHLLSLINDILDISKLEAGKYELEKSWINLSDVIAGCCALHENAAAAADLHFDRRVDENMPVILCDERAVRQVLLNLLSNAVKFTPPGGRVVLTAGRTDDGGVVVVISDTGIGIPEAALARIAQPFQQVDNSIARRFGGTGLGLAISRNLMELHGGRLLVNSVEGHGSTVTVVFPPTLAAYQDADEAGAA